MNILKNIQLILMCLILILLNKKIIAESINTEKILKQSSQPQQQPQQQQKTDVNLHHSIPSDLADLPTKFGDEDDVIINHGNTHSNNNNNKDDIIKITPNHPKTDLNINLNNNNNNNRNQNNNRQNNNNNKWDTNHHLEIPLTTGLGGGTGDHHLDIDDNYDDDDDDEHLGHHYPDKSENGGDSDYKSSNYDDETEFNEMLNNFGKTLNVGKSDLPIFLLDPQSTYVVRNKPAILKCKAAHALQLVFKCSGSSQPPPSVLESHVDPHSGIHFQEATATISRDLVDEFFGKGPFKCECHAWSPRGKVRSIPAAVEVAYIKKQFNVSPTSVRVELGGRAEIRCSPPNGAPPPKITWLKNGSPINSDPSVLVTAEGNILVSHATLQEMSNYTCVAENIAGKRISDPAILTVYVDGGWNAWGPWTECRCPGRASQGQRRTRTCSNPTPLHGGAPCGGPNVQKTQECLPCPEDTQIVSPEGYELLLGGRWSAWSDWTTCNSECIQTRRRSCINFDTSSPSVGARLSSDGIERGGGSCTGRDYHTSECTGGMCKAGKEGSDWTLYILLGVVAVLCVIIGAAFARGARRSRRLPPYSMARAEMQPEYFHDPDKKTIQFQPDLTQGVVGVNYEYPHHRLVANSGGGGGNTIGLIQNVPNPLPRSVSEHHYDVPHLTTNYASPLDRVSGNESYSSSNYSKRIHSTESLATTTNTSDSTYDVATEPPTLPMSHKNFIKSNTSRQIVTSNGGCLKLDHLSCALSIPDGALNKNTKQSIFLSVINEDSMRLRLSEKCTHISPIINTGPSDTILNKPVIIKLPHCAEELTQWKFSLFHTKSHIQDPDPKWQKIVSLGDETINTSCYVQLDDKNAYLMTEQLGRFVLIGESLEIGLGAVKRLKLCLFGPSVTPVTDCNIRVYVIEDVPSAIDHCVTQERRVGGALLGQSSILSYQDNGQDLNLGIKCMGGWRPKPGAENQKIPFSHVWNNSLSLHCAFALERTEQEVPGLRLEVNARQRQGGEVSAIHVAPFLPSERPVALNVIDEYSENSGGSGKSVTISEKGVTACISDTEVAFRLTKQSRKELCACLDPPTARGNDWRMLAQKLGVDRYIVFFATKQSPTEHILDLWECRNREPNALSDLVATLRSMGRGDSVASLEKTLGPSWL